MKEAIETPKSLKAIERATIAESLKPKLISLCEQANAALNGIATITKSDIVNLLLEGHSGSLSKDELDRLRVAHFDEVRFASWMATRLKEARSTGESVSLMELFEQGKALISPAQPRATRRYREKKQEGHSEQIEAQHQEIKS